MSPEPLAQLIAAAGDRLTPTERRIAEAVVAEPTLLAFGTVSDLAESVGTSRPSIVRFATKLGFAGYPRLQDHVRRDLATQLSRPSVRIRRGLNGHAVRRAIEESIDSVFAALDRGRLTELASHLIRANHVLVLSGETSRAGAHALVSGLSMLRSGVRLLEERNLGRDLADAQPGDLVIVIDFPRYRSAVVQAARLFAESGAGLLAITDGPLSPLAQVTDLWCAVDVPAIGPFDSSLPAVALAELLVMEVAAQQQAGATQRIDRTEEMWSATETFYEDS